MAFCLDLSCFTIHPQWIWISVFLIFVAGKMHFVIFLLTSTYAYDVYFINCKCSVIVFVGNCGFLNIHTLYCHYLKEADQFVFRVFNCYLFDQRFNFVLNDIEVFFIWWKKSDDQCFG